MPRTGRPLSQQTRAILAGTKTEHACNRCGVVLPFTAEHFGRQRHERGGLRKTCRACMRKTDRNSYQRQLAWQSKNPSAWKKHCRRQQLRRYGLSFEQYEEMLRQQDGRCAICGRPETTRNEHTGGTKQLHVDHCHETGRMRGLLCGRCNLAVGHVKESPETCRRMAAYLEERR